MCKAGLLSESGIFLGTFGPEVCPKNLLHRHSIKHDLRVNTCLFFFRLRQLQLQRRELGGAQVPSGKCGMQLSRRRLLLQKDMRCMHAHKLCQLKLDVTYISFTSITEDCLRDFVIRSKCCIADSKVLHTFIFHLFYTSWGNGIFLLPD
jgi:hypothetical protein